MTNTTKIPELLTTPLLLEKQALRPGEEYSRGIGGRGLEAIGLEGPVGGADARLIIEKLTEAINNGMDHKGVSAFAQVYVDYYFPVQNRISNSYGQGLGDIKTCNTYATLFGDALWSKPEGLRTGIAHDIQDHVMELVRPASDTRSQYELPELTVFRKMFRGIVNERVALDEINRAGDRLKQHGFIDVRGSTIDEDVEGGYDLVIRYLINGEVVKFLIDLKSSRSFASIAGQRYFTNVYGQPSVGLKHSRVGEDVIVIDIDTIGFGGRNTNQFKMHKPEEFINGLLLGIREVYKRNKSHN